MMSVTPRKPGQCLWASAQKPEDAADLLDICKDGDLDVSQTSLVAWGLDPCQVHLHSSVNLWVIKSGGT